MIAAILRLWIHATLWLRYRIRVRGLDEIAAKGTRGILFLPNHPALIDPIVVMACLSRTFAPRVLADKDQINRFCIRRLARHVGATPVPDLNRYGGAVRGEIETALAQSADRLVAGNNMVFYPSGHVYRTRMEDLRGNSGLEALLARAPAARVVLVRTRGLWGSSFSYAGGTVPNVAAVVKRGLWELAASGIFFAPRRNVTLDFWEPDDFPRTASNGERSRTGRSEINRFLEDFYNQDAPPNLHVPHTIWQGRTPRQIPEPQSPPPTVAADVPPAVRQRVTEFLRKITGETHLDDSQSLADDLGMDSLAKADVVTFLDKEFGHRPGDIEALRTVGEVLLAACGEAIVARPVEIVPAPRRWFAGPLRGRVAPPAGRTIAEAFLLQARRHPGRVVIADQRRGAMTYRDLVAAIMVLRPIIAKLPGDRVGILLPASVAVNVVYLSALFAGKTPVLLNWTAGARNMLHGMETAGVARVLTSAVLVARLAEQGIDLAAMKDRMIFLEDLVKGVSFARKVRAAVASRLTWASLRRAAVPATAAILFTSGSEARAKAVPLTHDNILANLRDVLGAIDIRQDHRLAAILPPFHALGLTVTMILPLVTGVRAFYHANPTEAWIVAKLIAAYRGTLLVGTPTFLSGIVRAAGAADLASLSIVVTGAERCPPRTYQALAERCPAAVILEGYGITECSPIVSVNRLEHPVPLSIGKPLPSVEIAIVEADTFAGGTGLQGVLPRAVATGQTGMLLVRGPSIFGGYLGPAPSPFVQFQGRQWYCTGDLVSQGADGVLTFRGRLGRFAKIGGEMISLPAIEAVLEEHAPADDEGPALAVLATAADRPELVLFSTRDLDRQAANQWIRQAGLSPLHYITRVVRLPQLPLLGTGKVDYRTLQSTEG